MSVVSCSSFGCHQECERLIGRFSSRTFDFPGPWLFLQPPNFTVLHNLEASATGPCNKPQWLQSRERKGGIFVMHRLPGTPLDLCQGRFWPWCNLSVWIPLQARSGSSAPAIQIFSRDVVPCSIPGGLVPHNDWCSSFTIWNIVSKCFNINRINI